MCEYTPLSSRISQWCVEVPHQGQNVFDIVLDAMNPLSYWLLIRTSDVLIDVRIDYLDINMDIMSMFVSMLCDGVGLTMYVTLLERVTGIEPALFQLGKLVHHHLCVTCIFKFSVTLSSHILPTTGACLNQFRQGNFVHQLVRNKTTNLFCCLWPKPELF